MSRSRLGRPPGPPPVASPTVEIGMGPAAVALAFLDLITAIAEDPKQARNLVHTDFLKQVPIKLKHEAEMWERLQQDIERLRNEKAGLVVSGKEALTRAKAEAADELQRMLQEKAAVELDLKDVKASLREAQAKEDFLKKANLDVQLRLEETTREGRLKEQELKTLLEGHKIQVSSLEKQLAEARDSLAAGSSAKAEEAEKTRRQLENALAKSAQLEVELAESKATAVRHESSLEASATKVKSLEQQLAEARDSLTDGSKAKAEEADKARRKLEDAVARCTQLEQELAESKATTVRHESSLEASATKVKSLEKQLAEARDSLAEGSRARAEEADKARRQLEDAMAKCTQLEEDLAETKATAVRHESSLEASATRVKSLERQLSEARESLAAGSSAKDQEGEKARRELEDARARCAQLEEALAESKAAAVRQERSLEISSTKLRSLEKQLDSMTAGSSAKEKEVAEARKELQEARAKCSQLEEALEESKANAVRQESSLEASANKLKSLEKQLTEARDSMTAGSSAKEKEVAEARKELQEARAKCSQLEEALAEAKATAARHESSSEASATKLKSLEKQLAEARDSLTAGSSAKEKEGEEKRRELDDARTKCSKLEEELAESKASAHALEASVTSLKKSEAALQEELQAIQTKLSAVEAELSTTTESLQHSNHRQDVLREEITRLGVLNQKLATELEGVKAEHERQSGRLGSDMEQLEDNLKEKDARLEQLTSKVQEVEGEREALEQELEQKGSELEALETRAQEAETEAARKLQDKEDEIVALKAEVRSLTEQLHGVAAQQGGEQDSMRAELLQKSTNLKLLQTQFDALRQENVALRASESELQQKASGVKLLQAQVESLKNENAALREEETELMSRLQRLEEHAKSMPGMEDNNLYSPSDMASVAPHSGLVLVIETGAYRTRFGVIDVLGGGALRNDEIVSVPSVIARPHKPNADLMSVVRNAGMQAGPMYNKFRDQGIFVGKDAWYCTFDHPDPVLRSSLKVESPFRRGTLERPGDLKALWAYVFETLQLDPSDVAVLMTYKPAITSADKEKMVSILFEECFVTRARFVNEAFLLSNTASAPTCLIVDIGEDTVKVVPVYEQLVVDGAIKTAPLGGVDLTRYMADMLLSCKDEQYSSLVPRKQLEVARRVKEKHAYVARDFDEQVAKMGKFVREKVDVSRALRPQGESQPTLAAPQHPDELVVHDHMLQDGRDVAFAIGRERFHCPELLFRPDLYSESEATKSLADLIIDSLKSVDYDFWEELLRNVVVAGHTSLLPGLLERLTLELKKRLPHKWVGFVHVVAAEKRLSEEDDCSAVWQGAALMASSVSEDDWLTSEVYQILSARGAASEIKYWA